ncbi:MAG: hypothetical protein M3434_09415 [Gemmatimonadota bacterium]|nr:hypothetical protein [Gemmatimonadota bacterium]
MKLAGHPFTLGVHSDAWRGGRPVWYRGNAPLAADRVKVVLRPGEARSFQAAFAAREVLGGSLAWGATISVPAYRFSVIPIR